MCTTDLPDGCTANPQCALRDPSGRQFCALICDPSAAQDSCGAGASCKAIQARLLLGWERAALPLPVQCFLLIFFFSFPHSLCSTFPDLRVRDRNLENARNHTKWSCLSAYACISWTCIKTCARQVFSEMWYVFNVYIPPEVLVSISFSVV